MKLGTQIKDYMTEAPQTIGQDLSLAKAMDVMDHWQIRHLPVQYAGKLVGVISDRDIKIALTLSPAARDLEVADAMVEAPYSVHASTPMSEVLSKMAMNKYGCAIVKNEGGRAIGIFTATDAVRILAELFHEKDEGSLVTSLPSDSSRDKHKRLG